MPSKRVPAHERVEGLARQIFHRHEDGVAVAIAVDHTHDVRVSQALQIVRFPMQDGHRVGVIVEGNGEHLDRDVRIVRTGFDLAHVDRLVDAAHAAFAELLDKAKASEKHRAVRDRGRAR